MMNPERRGERRIGVAGEELEEGLEVEAAAVEEIVEEFQMVEAVDDGLSVVDGGVVFLLELDQEPVEVINVHDSILRVPIEQCLDVRRSFAGGEVESSPETAADSVGLPRCHFLERE